jgi:hypothetical protein
MLLMSTYFADNFVLIPSFGSHQQFITASSNAVSETHGFVFTKLDKDDLLIKASPKL